MAGRQLPYRGIDWDNALEKRPEAAQALASAALLLERWLRHRAPATPLTLRLLEGFHRQLFAGVYPEFAGRLRGPATRYLPCNVTFGPYRGEPSVASRACPSTTRTAVAGGGCIAPRMGQTNRQGARQTVSYAAGRG